MSLLVEIYTDGACSGNPGPGGWGAILRYGSVEKELYGGDSHTTNNRMEMLAAIEGLQVLKKKSRVRLVTDSQYLRQGITQWIFRWKKNNWKTAGGQPVKNQDLWQQLDEMTRQHQIEWCWVKGHAGDELNERADALARKGAAESV